MRTRCLPLGTLSCTCYAHAPPLLPAHAHSLGANFGQSFSQAAAGHCRCRLPCGEEAACPRLAGPPPGPVCGRTRGAHPPPA